MNDPLRSNIKRGHFSQISQNNIKKDLDKIKNVKNSSKIEFSKGELPKKALVINLASREDRWERFSLLNKSLFEIFDVERFDARVKENPTDGIFESHLLCMKESKKIGDPILVLEDDCEMCTGWEEKLKNVFDSVPIGWDVIIGNHYFFSQINVISDHIAKPIGRASSVNFVIYHPNCYDKVKKELHKREENPFIRDIDHFLTSEETGINNYTIWPMISREFCSLSDHHNKIRNMEFVIREHSNQFQFIDSELYYPRIQGW